MIIQFKSNNKIINIYFLKTYNDQIADIIINRLSHV